MRCCSMMKSPLEEAGLWIAPVYLLKKRVFISYTHILVAYEVETLIQTTLLNLQCT